ncbi:GD13228 [Drosophila simulans]|uniref:Dynein axonemal assembly factor 1 homolog n=1 Tax=Drosophila simulans TaxID=7240 RepID=B4QR30_DROSI|nr:GD13228 [Drosophila simulans]
MAKCRGRSILNDETPTPEAACPAPAPAPAATPAAANPSPQPQQQQLQQQQNYFLQRILPQQQQHIQQPSELQVGQQQQLKRGYAAAAQIRQQQQQQQRNLPRGVGIQRQRSKSTSSSAASNSCRPGTAAVTPNTLVGSTGGTLVSGAIVTPQPNGICRIQRLPKEREELPDRINYDKRGLTAIPIFEQEPNLRLLSLQHNLINTFHIPKELTPPPPPVPPPAVATPRESNNNKLGEYSNGNGNKEGGRSGLRGHHPGRLTRAMTNAGGNSHRLSPKSGGSPGSGSPLTTQALAINGGTAAGRSKLAKRGYNYGQAQLTPPPALRMRYGLEKSKSFVSSSLQAMKHQQQLIQRRAMLKATRAGGVGVPGGAGSNLLQSCDEGSALHNSNLSLCGGCGEEEESPSVMTTISALEQLSIKNKQLSLSASYGIIFQQLVFLDLYDNQIERIANLDGLPSLSVLLLGKNRITDIGGLSSLKDTLRVLDLHGNKLTSLGSRINCLQQLKSLNLAGNQIRQINQQDFLGLRCLRELNLKRNKLRRINGFQHLVALERLWLCHNDLHRVDDMASIARATRLLEVTIENNPVSLAGDCVSFLVSYLPLLQTLSQMPITEQVRRAALAWRQHKEQAQAAPGSSEAYHNIRREEVISNARTNWELLRSQQTVVGRPKSRLTSELAKINESNEGPAGEEGETESEESQQPKELMDELQALIKLPPIAKDLRNPHEEDGVSSEASSLGPNVDSCSSCYSSDNDDGGAKNKPETPQIDENSNKVGLQEKPLSSPVPVASQSPEVAIVTPPAPVSSSPSPPALTLTPPAAPGTPVPGTTSPSPSTTIIATLPVPATASSNASRPTSSKQRSRHAPITQLGLQINQRGGATASSKRYMAGSLVRAQTVSSSTSNSSSSNSAGRGKATNNGLNLVATQTKAATNSTNQSSAGAAAGTGGSTTAATPSGAAATPNAAITVSKPSAAEREREQGGDYLIEICGRYLNIYGQGALRFIDKQWNPAKANDVHTLNFSYINFNSIVCVLGRIKLRFPHAEHYVFRETNISCLGQLNGLAELQGLSSLMIDAEGNGITLKESWRAYAIYRLSHWGLKQLNGQEVTEAEVEAANAKYVGLSDLVLWSMPEVMLQPLLARLRLDETCTASKLSPKEWLLRPDNKSLRLVVGKEALQWKKNAGGGAGTSTSMNLNQATEAGSTAMAPSVRDRGRQHFALLLENTCNAVEKLHKLETLWPSMLLDIVRNTLLDYAQLDVYLRNLMCELLK